MRSLKTRIFPMRRAPATTSAQCCTNACAAAGCALTFTHGTIGRSLHPHRLFAMVGMALGVFAIVFLGATPKLVAASGGAILFRVFAGVMLVGAVLVARRSQRR